MVYSRRGRRAVASLIDARRDRGCVPETRSDQIRYWFIKSWQAQLNNT